MAPHDGRATREQCEAIVRDGESRKAGHLAKELIAAMDRLAVLHGSCRIPACPTCQDLRRFNGLNNGSR